MFIIFSMPLLRIVLPSILVGPLFQDTQGPDGSGDRGLHELLQITEPTYLQLRRVFMCKLNKIIVAAVCTAIFLAFSSVLALADLTLSGAQTRGQGSDGKLQSSGVSLPQGGVIVGATDAAGAGLWLQGPNGRILRFTPGSKAVGAQLSAGTWYAYPNLPPKANTAGCSVTIRPSGSSGTSASSDGSIDGSYTGTWGEQGKLRLTVKNGAVSGQLSGTDSSGTVISINISGRADSRGSIQATTQGTIRSGGRSMAASGPLSGTLANGRGSGTWNFTLAGEVEPTPWQAQK